LRAFRIRFASIAPTKHLDVFLETLELSELPHRNQLAVDEKRVEPLALRPRATSV